MAFCANCGKPYEESHKFCQSCGMPLEPVAAVSASAAESVKFVIPNLSLPKSWGRFDNYTLVVTERRSLFTKLTQAILNETVKASRADAETQGKGFFGKWAAQMKGFDNYGIRYRNLTPDQILQETPGNFAIENSTLRRIKVKDESDFQDANRVQYEIEFQTATDKLKFKSSYDLESQLKQAYGPAIVK